MGDPGTGGVPRAGKKTRFGFHTSGGDRWVKSQRDLPLDLAPVESIAVLGAGISPA